MRGIRDSDIIQLIKYSYMDVSNQKTQEGYLSETNRLIRNKAAIGDTDIFLREGYPRYRARFAANARPVNTAPVRFDLQENLAAIRRNDRLNRLILIGHINDHKRPGNETGTGLVAYAFRKAETNEICFLCRGSEGGMLSFVPDWVEKIEKKQWAEIFQSEAWRDNFHMIFQDSAYFEPLQAFARRIISAYGGSGAQYSAYGHSKGGGLAIYLAALFEPMDGAALDGVGLPISTYMAHTDFIPALRRSKFRNIIADNDIVGKMLVHFEKRVFVQTRPLFVNEKGETVNPNERYAFDWAHYPDAIFTDENGMTVVSNKKRFLPTAVGILNNVLMVMILYDKLSETEKAENKQTLEALQAKSLQLLEKIDI